MTNAENPALQHSVDVRAPIVVPAGQTVAHQGTGYQLYAPAQTSSTILTIVGTVEVSGEMTPFGEWARGAHAQEGDYRQRFIIEKAGALRVSAKGPEAEARGYYVDSFQGASFLNEGHLTVTSDEWAEGVRSFALEGTYINRGTVQVIAPNAMGFYLANLQAPAYFQNSGSIAVHGGTAGRAGGVQMAGSISSFRNEANASIIVSHDKPAALNQIGWTKDIAVSIDLFSHERGLGDVFRNAGLIQGEVALSMARRTDNPDLVTYERRFLNEATGVLRGAVEISGTGVILDNAGLIDGAVTLGAYHETYDGSRGGRVTGMVSGGAGEDEMIGGPHFDYFQGNVGNDALHGGAGDDWVVGGKDNDRLYGDAGADIVYGNLGNDVCEGGDGNDTVRGGQDNDELRGGAGDDYLSGDKGEDTIAGGPGADLFHSFGDAGTDRVVDFNATEGDRVLLDPGTQYTVAQIGADTVINMTGGGQVILNGVQLSSLPVGWIFGA